MMLSLRVSVLARPAIIELLHPPRPRLTIVLRAAAGLVTGLFLATLPVVMLTMPGSPVAAIQLWLWRWLPDFFVLGLIVVWSVSVFRGYFAPLAALLGWTAWLIAYGFWTHVNRLSGWVFMLPPYRMLFTPEWNSANPLWRYSGEWLVTWLLFGGGLALIPLVTEELKRQHFRGATACALLLLGGAMGGYSLMDPATSALATGLTFRKWAGRLVPEPRVFTSWRVKYEMSGDGKAIVVTARMGHENPSKSPFPLGIPSIARVMVVQGCDVLSQTHYLCGGSDGSQPVMVRYEIPLRGFSVTHGLPCSRLALLYDLEGFATPRIFQDETAPVASARSLVSVRKEVETRLPNRLRPGCRVIGNHFQVNGGDELVCSFPEGTVSNYTCDTIYTDCYTIPVINESGLSVRTVPAHARYINEEKWAAVITAWQDTLRNQGLSPSRHTFFETPYGVSSFYYFRDSGFVFVFDHDTLSRLNALSPSGLAEEFLKFMGNSRERAELRTRTGQRFNAIIQEYLKEVARRAGD
jgi:hypothetical protein